MFNQHGIQEYIISGREKMVLLPEAIYFDGAKFDQALDDLIICTANGNRVFIRGFFLQQEFPSLLCDDGELMAGDLAAAFIKLSPCAMSALMEIDKDPEGQADTAS